MQTANVISKLIQSSLPLPALTLRTGQVISGKINKLYPNQTAEVQIGQTKVTAVIDAPLKAGEKYWFRVEVEDGTTRLRMLDGISAPNSKGAAEQLLNHLSVPIEKDAILLAEFVLKNNIPATKEFMQQALAWLKTSNNLQQGMNILKTIQVKNLPFSNDIFLALDSIENGESFSSLINQLSHQLKNSDIKTSTSVQLSNLISHLLEGNQEKLADQGLIELFKTVLKEDALPNEKQTALNVLKDFGYVSKNTNEKDFINNLITTFTKDPQKSFMTGSLKEGLAFFTNVKEAINTKNFSKVLKLIENYKALLENSEEISSFALESFKEKIQGAIKENSLNKSSSILQGIEILSKREEEDFIKNIIFSALSKIEDLSPSDLKMKIQSKDLQTILSSMSKNNEEIEVVHSRLGIFLSDLNEHNQIPSSQIINEKDSKWLQQLLQDKNISHNLFESQDVKHYLKQIIKSLGLDYENILSSIHKKGFDKNSDFHNTLKPLIMKLLQENDFSALKETAEQILHKITAQQVLSQEAGPVQNIVMQLPIMMNQTLTDLTLQWNGRKKADGSIDPGYCRILFYLDLENLKETAIDMQIQNRVIRITIFNEQTDKLKVLSQKWLSSLHENMEKLDYKISSISFVNNIKEGNSKKSPLSFQSRTGSYNGVDFRI